MKQLFLFFRVFALVALLAAVAVVPKQACAQLPTASSPSGIGVSVFVPNSSEAVRTGGSLQAAAELRYALPSVPLTPTRTILSLGAEWGSRDGKHSLIVPLAIAEYAGLSGKSPTTPGTAYVGAGIGYYLMQQSGFGNRAEVGGFGALGYNFPFGLFIEGKYQVVSRGNGGLISLGFRF
ncbi:MAG TPA: hypothetical protein VFW40_11110 [Capsulimonadaceae bacterium]|nr:hypothetical protein [Capsulimonadaceae bacterium]